MKQRIKIEQLNELSVDKLFKFAKMLHIGTKDVDTDEISLYDFRKYLKAQTSIGSLIELLGHPSMTYDRHNENWVVELEDKTLKCTAKELSDALWNSIKSLL